MVRKLFFAIVLFSCTIASFAAESNISDPKADPAAVVIAGNVRFTVLTSRLVRMEWIEYGVFEDNATLTFVNRRLQVPDFKVTKSKSKVVIKTSDLTLTYKPEGMFDSENLKVEFVLGGKKVLWTPGMEDDQNLMGTTRTLDGCDGDKLGKEPMEQGIVSRSGWSVVDDSSNHLLVPVDSHWKEWVSVRPEGERQDLYIFAYGHDYKGALSDYAKVAGRSPMPPKYTFGYWWSRYWHSTLLTHTFISLNSRLIILTNFA